MTINRDFAENLRAGGDLSGTFDITGDLGTFNNLTVNTGATVPYDNSISGLTATNIQSAITELNTLLGGGNIGSQATWNVYEFTTVGNDTSFDISTQGSPAPSYVPGYVKVYLNGLLLSESDYTAVDGSTVGFSPAIADAGQIVSIVVLDSFNTAELLRVTSIDASAATNSIVIDSNSHVGIGESTPANPLHVTSASTDVATFETSGAYTFLSIENATRNWALSVGDTFSVYDKTAAQTRLSIDSSGNVGIGTDSPTGKLDVQIPDSGNTSVQILQEWAHTQQNTLRVNMYGGATDLVQLAAINGEQNIAIVTEDSSNLSATTSKGIYIKTGGNVGIGTTSPNEMLHVNSADSAIRVNTTNPVNNSELQLLYNNDSAHGLIIHYHGNSAVGSIDNVYPRSQDTEYGDIRFRQSYAGTMTEHMRLTAYDGFLGIGTSSPKQKLAIVSGTNYAPPGLGSSGGHFGIFKEDTNASGDYGIMWGVQNTGEVWQQVQRRDGTATAYSLLLQPSGGDVLISTGGLGIGTSTTTVLDGTQVYIKKRDASTNLQRWGEGDANDPNSYRFRIDQGFDLISNSGSGQETTWSSSTGNITFASGSGINFNAAQSTATGTTPSSAILNDYEEGTWTPTVFSGGVTQHTGINNVRARYIKIGNCVHISATINFTSQPISGYLSIKQLPFIGPSAGVPDVENHGSVMFNSVNLGVTYSTICSYIYPGSGEVQFYGTRDNLGWSIINANSCGSSSVIQFSLTYFV